MADELVTEIKRHNERVRHDYIFKRKARDRADLSAAGPLLKKDVEHGRRNDFFGLLRPHLRFLRDQAWRALRKLELDGTLHRGELTVGDLLDEVLVLAWERFASARGTCLWICGSRISLRKPWSSGSSRSLGRTFHWKRRSGQPCRMKFPR